MADKELTDGSVLRADSNRWTPRSLRGSASSYGIRRRFLRLPGVGHWRHLPRDSQYPRPLMPGGGKPCGFTSAGTAA